MTPSQAVIYALDRSREARAVGVDRIVALGAGIEASFVNADDAAAGAFVKLILRGDGKRTPIGPGAMLVEVGGRQFVTIERTRASDGEDVLGILSLVEVQLAGTLEIELEVRQRIMRPAETLQ